MSWAEPENGIAEVEENPDPEEDSDLPQRQHGDGGDGEGPRGEEEGPEDDLAMSHSIPVASGDNSHSISSHGDDGGGQAIAEEAENRNVNAVQSDATVNGDGSSLGNGGAEIVSLQNAGEEDEAENGPGQYNAFGATAAVEGDSFEQDEETAAPECENEVRQEACSESDRQLFEYQEAVPNPNVSASADENSSALQEEGRPEQDAQEEQAAIPSLESAVVSEDANPHPVEASGCAFSGNVEVANTLEDAPEAEVGNMNQESYEEEDNLRLNVPQAASSDVQNSEDSPPLQPAMAESREEMSSSSGQNLSLAERSEGAVAGSIDSDLQAPECDREAVPPQNQIPVDNSDNSSGPSEGVVIVSPRQTTNDNNEGDPQPPAAPSDMFPSSGNDSGGNAAAVVEDSQDSPSAATSSLAAPQSDNLSSSPPSNDQSMPTIFTDSDTIEGNCVDNPKPSDNIAPAQSPFSSPSHEATQHLPVDNPSLMQPSGTNSDYDHSKTAQLSNQQTFINSSIPVNQENMQANTLNSESSSDTNSQPHSVSGINGLASNVKEHHYSSSISKSESQLASGSSSQSPAALQHSSPTKTADTLSHAMAMDSNQYERKLAEALQSDDDDDLLHELDAALLSRSSKTRSPHKSPQRSPQNHASAHSDKGDFRQDVNGLQPLFDVRQLQGHNRQLLEQLKIRDAEIARLARERDVQKEELSQAKHQVDSLQKKLSTSSSHSSDDLYLPQIKELEKTIAQQQNEIKALKEKLVSHDSAAKKAVTTLQNELKSRVDQVTKMYEDCLKEKDMMVIRFAESEAKNMDAKRIAERSEAKVKEAMRDKENMMNALKAAKADKQRAVTNFEMKCAEIGNLHKELEKLKEAVNSSDYRIKWFQNKLKDELEAHKETKGNLEKTSTKLREAREETEMIRKECQAIVKRYQESEEIKSNSLDKELKMKETELRTQMQERNDTEEIHQMTKRELDSLKAQHKDTIEEAKTYKDKVHCLEEERQQNHQMIENYQEIMQRQKSDNAELKAKVSSFAAIEEDYKRAQEMIQTLDKDIAELKVSNRDLQKDMESCRERESKLLNLQSELSRTNAMLRSENTNLSNRASNLTGEVEKLKMEVQELETTVKDLSDKYEEEKAKRKEEVEKIGSSLTEKTKECNDYKQKWEDEMDSSKTLKRRHANNVKDLTRQLHQVKRRLESLEGKGDAGSMGSRTNSNGSLNSVDNSTSQQAPPPPLVQEFPVITEQVEVDKQVLIERIVRLQKSHARKNEKLEFLGEHIQQLLEEIKKKNRIIQCYALREESGALSSEDMDANKTLLARKGGIMASVYSVHQQDGNMTLELSLQINKKLQAVLEDTLLKNITLKESLDTLGEEIARLSQENRRLQLHLQEIEPH